MLPPPAIHIHPPINTALTPSSPETVTKNGATIFPKLDIASEIPVPVDLMEVGKDSVVIRLKRAKPKVLKSLLNAIKII